MDTRNRPITFRDHCFRTSSLLDLVSSQLEQSRLLVNAIALNYPCLYGKWLSLGTSLASLQHQMEEQSRLFVTMGSAVTKDIADMKMTTTRALEIYSQICEAKNEQD